MDIERCVCVYAPTAGMQITIGDFVDVFKYKWRFMLTLNECGLFEVSLVLLNYQIVDLHVQLYVNSTCVLDDFITFHSNQCQYLHSTELKVMMLNLRTECVSSPKANRVSDFQICSRKHKCYNCMLVFMDENDLKISYWTRVVHSGYGREILMSLLKQANFHVVDAGSKSRGIYVFVDGTRTQKEIYEMLQPYVCYTRSLSNFSGMRKGNKCRTQIKETIQLSI